MIKMDKPTGFLIRYNITIYIFCFSWARSRKGKTWMKDKIQKNIVLRNFHIDDG